MSFLSGQPMAIARLRAIFHELYNGERASERAFTALRGKQAALSSGTSREGQRSGQPDRIALLLLTVTCVCRCIYMWVAKTVEVWLAGNKARGRERKFARFGASLFGRVKLAGGEGVASKGLNVQGLRIYVIRAKFRVRLYGFIKIAGFVLRAKL